MKIGIFTALCEQDKNWLPQFMKQCEILGYPVSWYADHLSLETLIQLEQWPLTFAIFEGKAELFSEKSKGKAMDALVGHFDWAIQMDIDETWEAGAELSLPKELSNHPDGQTAEVPMVTVFKDKDVLYQRLDPYFKDGVESKRCRIYNLKYQWGFADPITCGAYRYRDGSKLPDYISFPLSISTVHWGYWTHELMEKKKKKWDEVYTKVVGRNPYEHVYQSQINGNVIFDMILLLDKYYKHLN